MNKEDSVSTNDENKYRRSPPHTTDEESPLYRSHSSFSNTDSFVSLISRKPSFARSSNTLLERYGSIHEDFEEHDGDNEDESDIAILKKLKNRSLNNHEAGRRPSIKFLNEKPNTRSTYSLASIKCEAESENDTVSLSKFDEANTNTNSNNFLNLLPPMTRKPSITFSETVSIFRTGRRGSSPCSSQASETETVDVYDGAIMQHSMSEERLPLTSEFMLEEANEIKRKSFSLCSVYSDSEVVKNPDQILIEDENGLNLAIPKIKRRRSIDVSQIEHLLNLPDLEGQPSLIAPSITISQYNSNIGLNRSVISLNNM